MVRLSQISQVDGRVAVVSRLAEVLEVTVFDNYNADGPIIKWEDFGYEGWKPRSYPNIKSALLDGYYSGTFVITRKLDFETVEKPLGDTQETGS